MAELRNAIAAAVGRPAAAARLTGLAAVQDRAGLLMLMACTYGSAAERTVATAVTSSGRPAPGLLEPLQLQSTPAVIADRLRAEILQGRFPPHTQLAEVELARQLRVSRGPIREAMQRLIQEGLLRAERNRGVFVVELGSDDARDIYLARGVVERAAAAIVARRRPEAALRELQAIVV